VISYGNTALSLALELERRRSGLADPPDRYGCALVPAGLSEWTLGPSSAGTTLSGERVVDRLRAVLDVVELAPGGGLIDDDGVVALARTCRPHARQVVNLTEGIAIPAYVGIIAEAVEQLGRPPDVCLVPFGAGILCNEIMDYLRDYQTVVVPLSVPRADSLARMLYGPYWLDVAELARNGVAYSRHRSPDPTGARRHPYRVYEVREHEILRGLERAANLGISAEPSGAVGLGILDRLPALVPALQPDSLVLVLNTGNGIDSFPDG
jgi:hypothetical protein